MRPATLFTIGITSCLFACLSTSCALVSSDSTVRFLATGDTPYSAEQDTQFRQLVKQAANDDFDFFMHVGDIKGQSEPCSDERFAVIRDVFRDFPTPVVFTPGDNEWTDCHGVGADPIERLQKLREMFFDDEDVLRLSKLGAQHQSCDPRYKKFIENYRFMSGGALFIVPHVAGSGNNRREDDAPSMEEYNERNAANLAFLQESFEIAIEKDVPGVALIIHANPKFEDDSSPGHVDFNNALRDFLDRYHKPVVCIHGDTHYYRIDKPLRSLKSRKTYLNFTRMEVFGSPNVAGVVVTVDASHPEVFTYQPYYIGQGK